MDRSEPRFSVEKTEPTESLLRFQPAALDAHHCLAVGEVWRVDEP